MRGKKELRESKKHPVGTTEYFAGILTDEASASIKKYIENTKSWYIDAELRKYHSNMYKESTFDSSIGTAFEVNPYQRQFVPAIAVGITKYVKDMYNSGIFTFASKKGTYSAIANATISLLISKAKTVGDILSWVYSFYTSNPPNKSLEAQAKTMYSYRYQEDQGHVYYFDYNGYAYYHRATATSRDTFEHYWGQYTDTQTRARQKTYGYPNQAK